MHYQTGIAENLGKSRQNKQFIFMPTSGTHITILQRLAASDPELKKLLGDPFADEGSPEGKKMRFANLGAAGPDIFYAMLDYGSGAQDFENLLVKVGATFQSLSEVSEEINTYINDVESEITDGVTDSIKETFSLITGVVKEGILDVAISLYNFWHFFRAARQRKDSERTGWFWADYLHYARSGKFAKALLKNSKATRNPNLHAYALGYLTHYVTDVVGHPYVNQVVQGPWRLYWQRHHLVENFIDAYVWDRWHTSVPRPSSPSTEEQPLDRITNSPNATGKGAPYTFSRIHDLVNIGHVGGIDPIDGIINSVSNKIQHGLFDIGIAEDFDIEMPNDPDFKAWQSLLSKTLREVYPEYHKAEKNFPHPLNLTNQSEGSVDGRFNGYPTEEDIASAYSIFRLIMKISTEDNLTEPQPPDILSDITHDLDKLLDDLQNDLGSFPPVPSLSTSGSFSWDAMWDAIKNAADWITEVAEHTLKTLIDFIEDMRRLGTRLAADLIKYALFIINKLIFAVYRYLRDVMVLNAYTVPFTEQLSVSMGPIETASLWQSNGNLPKNMYPIEEIHVESVSTWLGVDPLNPPFVTYNKYEPFRPPITQTNPKTEQPNIAFAAPYAPKSVIINGHKQIIPALPDDFIDSPLGPDDLFKLTSLQPAIRVSDGQLDSQIVDSFAASPKNFGGAIENCKRGIRLAENGFPGGTDLPDYNLDADRGYAWGCWNIENIIGNDLDPFDVVDNPGGIVLVSAVDIESENSAP